MLFQTCYTCGQHFKAGTAQDRQCNECYDPNLVIGVSAIGNEDRVPRARPSAYTRKKRKVQCVLCKKSFMTAGCTTKYCAKCATAVKREAARAHWYKNKNQIMKKRKDIE